MPKKASYLTVTDQFCGAGGSSIGATAAGLELRMALNHWKLAIETHNTNFPDADHDCTDVSACDPRRYPSTDILITSPECTNHSLAKGKRRKGLGQIDAFTPAPLDPADERSRATMWDVPRFAEYHGYRVIIVENVVDAKMWVMYPAWLKAMDLLGYDYREVFLNSMFAHPTPQSRDRMYIVFWKKGNRAPDLEIRPTAPCPRCAKDVEAIQSWKPGRSAGRYRRQYVYCCPACAQEVEPYYYAALNAIDWSIPGERIGDKPRPLKERTLARIRYGLGKYGRTPLVVTTRYASGIDHRVRAATVDPIPTQPGHISHALVHPAFLATLRGTADDQIPSCARGLDESMSGITAGGIHHALVQPAAVVNNMANNQARGLDGALHNICTGGNLGLATLPPAFLATAGSRETGPVAMADPTPTFTGSDRFGLVVNPSALVTLRDMKKVEQLVHRTSDPLTTQVAAGQQHAVVSRSPFLVSYYGQDQASAADEAMRTLTTKDRHALIEQGGEEPDINDCYFRMLQPHEIGKGMAFPGWYKVLGTKRDQVKQFGNAVTPPAMQILIERVVASLES